MRTGKFFLLVILSACNQKPSDKTEANTERAKVSVVPETPEAFHEGNILGRWKSYRDSALQLPPLKADSSTDEIRVSQEFSDRSGRMVVIKKKGTSWHGRNYKYKYTANDAKKGEVIQLSQIIELGRPTSGWDSLMTRLMNLGILSLPDYTTLPNYSISTDEQIVTVEIAKKSNYRIYSYLGPHYRQKQFLEAKKMVQILNLIDEEFNLR